MTDFLNHLLHEFQLPLKNPVLIFSLVLLIILLSPILLRKLKIPGIIGLIVSGVVIGPFGFNILEKTSAIQLFSTIGLLYIMFIAGLELDLNQFKVNRNKSAVFGFLTFAIPLGIGYPVCRYLLGYAPDASFLTASMFATHTLVAYPIVSKLGVSKNQAVAVAVGGTILTDTAVLILLAVIIGSHDGSLNQEFWIRLSVSLVIFTGIMFLIIPRIAKWFFRKLESEKHSHYIFVLSVVFFAAFLAEVAGVEPIIGAFVAGLSLNKLIPHSSALMNRVEFIGNSLFIPFFLISVGMLVDVRVIFNGKTAIIVAGALTLAALFSKWLAAFMTQKIFRFSVAQRQLIFGLSSAHAAATLAVILVGYNAGILDENILNGTIILILITCVVASFVAEKAAKQIKIEEDFEADEKDGKELWRDECILIPSTEMVEMSKLLDFANLIKEAKSVNPIFILSVVPDDSVAEMKIKKMKSRLEQSVLEASATDLKIELTTSIDHNVTSGIIRKSRELLADIVILKWPKRQGIVDKLLEDSFDQIMVGYNRATMFCHIPQPIVSYNRIFMVLPPFSEHETGFKNYIKKINKFSIELSSPILVFCSEETKEAMKELAKKERMNAKYRTFERTEWDDFEEVQKEVHDSDFLFFVSARKGTTSYFTQMDHLPEKVERLFGDHARIIIFPDQYSEETNYTEFMEYSGEPLQKGIEGVRKIKKNIGTIFKKGE